MRTVTRRKILAMIALGSTSGCTSSRECVELASARADALADFHASGPGVNVDAEAPARLIIVNGTVDQTDPSGLTIENRFQSFQTPALFYVAITGTGSRKYRVDFEMSERVRVVCGSNRIRAMNKDSFKVDTKGIVEPDFVSPGPRWCKLHFVQNFTFLYAPIHGQPLRVPVRIVVGQTLGYAWEVRAWFDSAGLLRVKRKLLV